MCVYTHDCLLEIKFYIKTNSSGCSGAFVLWSTVGFRSSRRVPNQIRIKYPASVFVCIVKIKTNAPHTNTAHSCEVITHRAFRVCIRRGKQAWDALTVSRSLDDLSRILIGIQYILLFLHVRTIRPYIEYYDCQGGLPLFFALCTIRDVYTMIAGMSGSVCSWP